VSSPAAPTAASSAAAAPPTTGQPRRPGRAGGARVRHKTAGAGRPGAPPSTREAPWVGARGPKRPLKREGGATSNRRSGLGGSQGPERPTKREGGATSHAARASMPRLDGAPPRAAAQQHDLWRGLAGALRRAPRWFDDWQKKDVQFLLLFDKLKQNRDRLYSVANGRDPTRDQSTGCALSCVEDHVKRHWPQILNYPYLRQAKESPAAPPNVGIMTLRK